MRCSAVNHLFTFSNIENPFAGAESWRAEYRRLTNNVPMVMTDVLTFHSHQVLHVSFSHNGKMFATCSKDGFVIVSIRNQWITCECSWRHY